MDEWRDYDHVRPGCVRQNVRRLVGEKHTTRAAGVGLSGTPTRAECSIQSS